MKNATSILTFVASLSPFFPALMNWIKGNNGETIAKHVITAAKTITGQEDPRSITRIFAENPEVLARFQQTLHHIAREYHLEEVTDRSTARARDIAIIQSGQKNARADVMVLSAALGLILCLISLGLYKTSLPGEAVGIISTIAGIFGSCLKDAYAFEFGSSRGSKEKDFHVKSILKQLH